MDLSKAALDIWTVVELDLTDRRGFRQEWDQMDEQIQEEIRQTNMLAIKNVLAELLTK